MGQEVKKEEPGKKLVVNLKYRRSSEMIEMAVYVKEKPNGGCEALLEHELGNKDKGEFNCESIAFIQTWADLEGQLQRSSTVFGIQDHSIYTRLLLMYCLKRCSFATDFEFEKDEIGIERMAPSFADAMFGQEGLPLPVVNAIIRAINSRI